MACFAREGVLQSPIQVDLFLYLTSRMKRVQWMELSRRHETSIKLHRVDRVGLRSDVPATEAVILRRHRRSMRISIISVCSMTGYKGVYFRLDASGRRRVFLAYQPQALCCQ